MSNYQERIEAFTRYSNAAAVLKDDNSELFLSIDVKEAFSKVAALMRVRDSIESPTSEDEAYAILADLLGEILRDGKVDLPSYGLSTEGRNQFRALVARVSPAAVSTVDPRETYSDVVAIFQGPASVLNEKMRTEPFRTRFNEAVAAGVI